MAERLRLCGRSLAVMAVALSVARGEALAQNSRDELPIPASPKEDLTAIQRTFKPPPPPLLTLFPKARDQLQDLPPFLRDSKVGLDPRSNYRDVVTNSPGDTVTVKEAWPAGGFVSFESGRLAVGVLVVGVLALIGVYARLVVSEAVKLPDRW